MVIVFEVLLVISSLLLILMVLLHKGRGGGLSDMFGGGVSSGIGGSSVAERNLDRITIGAGIIWLGASVKFTAPVRIGDTVITETEIVEVVADNQLIRVRCTAKGRDGAVVM